MTNKQKNIFNLLSFRVKWEGMVSQEELGLMDKM